MKAGNFKYRSDVKGSHRDGSEHIAANGSGSKQTNGQFVAMRMREASPRRAANAVSRRSGAGEQQQLQLLLPHLRAAAGRTDDTGQHLVDAPGGGGGGGGGDGDGQSNGSSSGGTAAAAARAVETGLLTIRTLGAGEDVEEHLHRFLEPAAREISTQQQQRHENGGNGGSGGGGRRGQSAVSLLAQEDILLRRDDLYSRYRVLRRILGRGDGAMSFSASSGRSADAGGVAAETIDPRSALRRRSSIREPSRASQREKSRLGEPVSLPMKIVSCDGGRYDDVHSFRNMLRNDNTVYCSQKRNRINVLLRHTDAHGQSCVFSSITIKAPKANYSSPVTCGLIFISMKRIHLDDVKRYNHSEDYDDSSRTDEELYSTFSDGDSETFADGGEFLFDTQPYGSSGSADEDTLLKPASSPTTFYEPSSDQTSPGIDPVAEFVLDSTLASCTVEFNPHISGRYVFLKLFSTKPSQSGLFSSSSAVADFPADNLDRDELFNLRRRRTVDVQCIRCFGHNGKRVFPSLTPA